MALNKQLFDECFEVFIADTAESKKINFKIRYAVFCAEMGREYSDLFPDKMEWDDLDADAVHFIVRNRYTGHWVAAMRLVQQNYSAFSSAESSITNAGESKQQLIVDAMELSRCCVIKEGRQIDMSSLVKKQVCENSLSSANNNVIHLKNFKLDNRSIIMGLYRAAALYLRKNNISYVYLFLTQGMLYHTLQQGFAMNLVGNVSEHQGLRSLYRYNIEDYLAESNLSSDSLLTLHLYSESKCQTNVQRKISL